MSTLSYGWFRREEEESSRALHNEKMKNYVQYFLSYETDMKTIYETSNESLWIIQNYMGKECYEKNFFLIVSNWYNGNNHAPLRRNKN